METKAKVPFLLLKVINTILVILPFLGCWYGYYEPITMTNHSRQVSVLLFIIYVVAFYYTCHKMDGFRTSIMRIGELIFSQIISIGVADVCAAIMIWMLSIHFPNLLPGFLCFLAQCVVIVPVCFVMHKVFFKQHPPQKTLVVYDVRQGMENLVATYGLEKRFEVIGTCAVEDFIVDMLSGIDVVFLCGVHSHERNVILKECIYRNVKMYIIPRIGDVMMSASEPMHMLHLPIVEAKRYNPPAEYRFIKRLFDIVSSGLLLLVISPLFLIIALLVKSDGGPAFYKQTRLTKDGKEFKILKFRSMCVDAEKYSGAVLSSGENDPRITKVGRVIRACRLDELPQLINIFKGDMSVVGPRPERPEIAAEYEKELPEFKLRLQAKAGLTGYAQVYGKYNTTPYDKLLMDLMYIARPSMLEDMSIIIATLKILFDKESTEGVGTEAETVYKVRRGK